MALGAGVEQATAGGTELPGVLLSRRGKGEPLMFVVVSREEEPVLQRCDVAAGNTNWN